MAASALVAVEVTAPVLQPAVTVIGGAVAAVAGAFSGAWVTHRFASATALSEARKAARTSLAELYVLIWPPTEYAVLLSALDRLDSDLIAAGIELRLRSAMAEVAQECWTDGAASAFAGRAEEAGIATKLLEAYRLLRTAVLLELSPTRRRSRAAFVRSVLGRADQFVAETRADRNRRTLQAVCGQSPGKP